MNIIEAIKERRSVRSFNGEPLSESIKSELRKAVAEAQSPFGGNLTIRLKEFDLKNGYKPSTYGMIKGATDFFLLGIGDGEASALTAGFAFEQVVLRGLQRHSKALILTTVKLGPMANSFASSVRSVSPLLKA